MKVQTGSAPRMAHQRGNALVFLMMALVLGAIIIAVGVQQFRTSERSTSVQEVVAEVSSVIGDAKSTYGAYGFAGLTTQMAVNARVIPPNRANGNAALNKFSGAITLVSNNAAVAQTALLSYVNVPQELCVAIVTGTEGMARQVQVGAVDVKPLDGALALGTLDTQCTAAGTVAITWTVGRT